MTVTMIVGLLASLAVPGIESVRIKSQNSALLRDLRTFEGAFLLYIMENGHWPSDQNRGVLPPEMMGYLSEHNFTRPTPIGGQYDWDPSSSGSLPGGIQAAVSVRDHRANDKQIAALLANYDDGNPGTGRIRVNGSDLHFVIE